MMSDVNGHWGDVMAFSRKPAEWSVKHHVSSTPDSLLSHDLIMNKTSSRFYARAFGRFFRRPLPTGRAWGFAWRVGRLDRGRRGRLGDHRIQSFQLYAGLGGGEPPIDSLVSNSVRSLSVNVIQYFFSLSRLLASLFGA